VNRRTVHLYLIGYRGTGKSTVGRRLAERLAMPFVDLDDAIEQSAGMSIRSIFETQGEAGFRGLESTCLYDVSDRDRPHVVSLGGGAILREANRQQLRTSGRTVWLTADEATIVDRIANDPATEARRPPLSTAKELGDEVRVLLRERTPLYRQLADLQVDATGAIDDLVTTIEQWWCT
jgi:shikimate kinase